MIPVSRDQRDDQGQSIRPSLNWFKSAGRAADQTLKDFAALVDGESLKFNSDVYGHNQVRAALEKLFHLKCAYCETPVVAGFDVEHFRPKGRVADAPDHPGYYWVAYTWENLLPSCVPCNQRRKDPPTWDDPSTGESAGKLDQFPLEEGSFRASDPSHSLADERPLLLNPYLDNPAEHFTCNFFTGALLPRSNSVRAETSIKVFNLNRKRLREQRKTIARRLKDEIAELPDSEQPLTEESRLQRNFTDESLPYAGFARILVNDPSLIGLAGQGFTPVPAKEHSLSIEEGGHA